MYLLRRPILALSGSTAVRDGVTRLPVTRAVVHRFVPGEHTADAVRTVGELQAAGLTATLDHLGENVTTADLADATVRAYLEVLDAMVQASDAAGTEVSVKLSAVGLSLPGPDSADRALAAVRKIADAAYAVGARMTIDMEDHTSVDATLQVLAELRREHPDVGVAMQAMLRRTETDLAKLTGTGSRVRLVKGAYDEPEEVAYRDPVEVDLAYVRCLKVLMNGNGYPMVGSHDPRMIAIAQRLAEQAGRPQDGYEHQLLYGIRPEEQRRLVAAGYRVRVYVPYGTDWYGYFTRRLAERPANLLFFLRSVAGRN